jgi:hypothetical protein
VKHCGLLCETLCNYWTCSILITHNIRHRAKLFLPSVLISFINSLIIFSTNLYSLTIKAPKSTYVPSVLTPYQDRTKAVPDIFSNHYIILRLFRPPLLRICTKNRTMLGWICDLPSFNSGFAIQLNTSSFN